MNTELKEVIEKLETADQYIVAVKHNKDSIALLVRCSGAFVATVSQQLFSTLITAGKDKCDHCSSKDFAESFKDSEPEDLEEEVRKLQAEVSFLRTALNIWSGGPGKNKVTMKGTAEEIKNAEQEGDN